MTDAPPASRSRPHTRRCLAGLVAVVAVVAVAGMVGLRPSSTSDGSDRGAATADGRRAPGFELADLRNPGERITLAQFEGRPVVLNFWGSWCNPCKQEMPDFQAVYESVGDRVAFVGIDHQDGRSGALALLEQTGVEYPAAYDPEGRVARAYGLYGMPVTVFVSPDGRQLARHQGRMSRRQLEDEIRRLFG